MTFLLHPVHSNMYYRFGQLKFIWWFHKLKKYHTCTCLNLWMRCKEFISQKKFAPHTSIWRNEKTLEVGIKIKVLSLPHSCDGNCCNINPATSILSPGNVDISALVKSNCRTPRQVGVSALFRTFCPEVGTHSCESLQTAWQQATNFGEEKE